jgi:hypothetical protein
MWRFGYGIGYLGGWDSVLVKLVRWLLSMTDTHSIMAVNLPGRFFLIPIQPIIFLSALGACAFWSDSMIARLE